MTRNSRGQFTNGNGNGRMTKIQRSPELVQRMPHSLVKASGQRVDLDEIGTSGLRHYGGFVLEEWLRQLQGPRAAFVYREMQDNDPVIGAILFAIEMLARNAEVSVTQGKDADSAEFVEQCMGDMSHTWDDLVSEALSMLSYGWSYHEIVYKRRAGPQFERPMDETEPEGAPEDVASSAFDDGRIGWRKMPVRAQETLMRWVFDDRGGTQAMLQVDPQGRHNTIPIQKALLFRPRARRGNPEGRSLLRNAFVPWYRLKNIQEIEAIGIERDLAGLPVATPPEGVDLFTEANAHLLEQVQALVTTIRRDEDEGVVLPQSGWQLELLTTGGSRQIDTDAIVRRYEQRIASSVLADFLLIGQDAVGSFAMVDVKSDIFALALDTLLGMLADVVNRYAIPRLLRLNGMPLDDPPQITYGSTGRVDLQRIATFLELLSTAGAPIPWSKTLIENLFEQAGIPAEFDEAAEQAAERQPVEPVAPEGDDKQPGSQPASQNGGQNDSQNAKKPDGNAALPGSAKPVAKADAPRSDVHPIVHRLHENADQLQRSMSLRVGKALDELGRNAQSAYLGAVSKADASKKPSKKPSTRADQADVGRVMKALNLRDWIATLLKPIFRRQYQRVLADTVQTINAQIGLAVNIPDPVARKIVADGGTRVALLDVEQTVRDAIFKAISEGRSRGEGPQQIARQIREMVPAGRFTHAGSAYRSRLIATNETLHAQRMSQLAAYEQAPSVTAVRVHDGIFGEPRSDEQCIGRDGDEVSIEDARAHVQELHPQCTLSFSPVIGTPAPAPEGQPAQALEAVQ